MKKVTCPGCAKETEVNSIQLNAGNWVQCTQCNREFRIQPGSQPTAHQFEIKADDATQGSTASP